MKRTDQIRKSDLAPRGSSLIAKIDDDLTVRVSQSRHWGMALWTVEEIDAEGNTNVVEFQSKLGGLKKCLRKRYPRAKWEAGTLEEADTETWKPSHWMFEPVEDMQEA